MYTHKLIITTKCYVPGVMGPLKIMELTARRDGGGRPFNCYKEVNATVLSPYLKFYSCY